MSRKQKAFAIVVDASVYGGAGRGPEAGPAVIPCIDALRAIDAAGMCVVLSESLLAEGHRGRFARKWLSDMVSRKRARMLKDVPRCEPLLDLLPELRDRGVAKQLGRDLHLVEAALATDNRILSLDDKMRGHLGRQTVTIAELRRLHWANPRHAQCCEWLLKGAPNAAVFLLG